MKRNLRLFILLFAAAFAIAACNKSDNLLEKGSATTVNFTAESIETKTVFGEKTGGFYPTLWTPGHLKISLNFATPKDAAVAPSSDQATSSFSASFQNPGSGPYTFYSLSPKSAYVNIYKNYKNCTINIPTDQTPTAASVDEAAQLLWAKSASSENFPSSINLQYKHVTAYGKLDILNLNLGGRTISSVNLVASKKWAGRYYLYLENHEQYIAGSLKENSSSSSININTSSSSGLWFACAPVEIGGGAITVKVNTDDGIFAKTINIPAGKKFEAGKVVKFSVDMDGVSPTANVVYNLVNSRDELTLGSKVIIVAAGYNKAMGSQRANNRAAVDITKSNNSIINPPADVQVFDLQKGNKNNTAAFHCAEGYIYAASSNSNHLKTAPTLNDNASWDITITGSGTTVVAQGTYTRKNLRYNLQGDGLFSAYASAQKPVVLYKEAGSGSAENIFAP